MRHRITLVRLVCWGLVLGFTVVLGWRATAPVLDIQPNPCDLGLLPLGREVARDVTLRNTGWRSLNIIECRSTCGCSRLELSRPLIPPGQSAVVRVTVYGNTTQRPGELSAILLKTDAREAAEVRIPIITQGVSGLRLIPDSIDFGSVPIESLPHPVRAKVVIDSGQSVPQIDRYRCRTDDARMSARLEPASDNALVLVVELSGECEPGDYWTHVTTAEQEGRHTGTFPVHARVLGSHMAKPGMVMLDSDRALDRTAGRAISVCRRRDGTADGLKIVAVELPVKLQAVATFEVEPDSSVTLRLQRNHPTQDFQTRVQHAVRIRVHDPMSGESLVTIPVVVTLRAASRQEPDAT